MGTTYCKAVYHNLATKIGNSTVTQLAQSLSIVAFFLFFIGGPVWKFYESMYNWPRINITAIYAFISAILILLIIAKGKHQSWNNYVDRLGFSIAILYFWLLILQLVQLPNLINKLDLYTIGRYYARTTVMPLILILMGWFYGSKSAQWRKPILWAWYFGIFSYLAGALLYGGNFHKDWVNASIYLDISDLFAMTALLVLGNTKSYFHSILVLLVSCSVLFILNSRFTFGAFLLCATSYLFYRNWRISSALFVICAICGAIALPFVVEALGTNHRMLRPLLFVNDSSIYGRLIFLKQEISSLDYTWFTGTYMYDVLETGMTGTYAHNYLSFLSAFGLAAFTTLSIIIILCLKRGRQLIQRVDPASTLILLFVILSMLFARSYMYAHVWFAITAIAANPYFIRKYPTNASRNKSP